MHFTIGIKWAKEWPRISLALASSHHLAPTSPHRNLLAEMVRQPMVTRAVDDEGKGQPVPRWFHS
jgi:hypothetical protein